MTTNLPSIPFSILWAALLIIFLVRYFMVPAAAKRKTLGVVITSFAALTMSSIRLLFPPDSSSPVDCFLATFSLGLGAFGFYLVVTGSRKSPR